MHVPFGRTCTTASRSSRCGCRRCGSASGTRSPWRGTTCAACATGARGPELALSPGAVRLIETWSWPGNVRELFNAVECAVVLCRGDVIEPSDFPARIVDAPPTALEPSSTSGATPRLVDVERRAIEDAIAACGGNLSEVVRRLGMPRSTLYRRLRAYGLMTGAIRRGSTEAR